MLNLGIRSLANRIFVSALSKETRLVLAFNNDPQENYKALIDYFKYEAPDFKRRGGGLTFYSENSNVRVCDDIFGYEVKIAPNDELLDCCPAAYGLLKPQAMDLYDAILSCVPGSIFYKDKVEAKISRGGKHD